MKRFFDITIAFTGLVFLLPLMIVVGILVKSDGGPVFFRQLRVGLGGRHFHIFKFRSMVLNAEKFGSLVTAQNDPRITTVGRFLRITKLDELPQLLNVITGDMSLVGPRPEVPFYVRLWPVRDRNLILSIKPGITDFATLLYDNEQALLAHTVDHERLYIEKILPHKLYLYNKYIHKQSCKLDFFIIVATLMKIIRICPGKLVFKMLQKF